MSFLLLGKPFFSYGRTLGSRPLNLNCTIFIEAFKSYFLWEEEIVISSLTMNTKKITKKKKN